ncbi:MAG TPA: twitch domain-containing radical SAM protein [Thermoanaerobaculia bacterium]|nr:twitch domain-containing radical SAM protein [Thermoanaerobaculia bacterium]
MSPPSPEIKRSNTLCDRPFVHLYAEADGEVRPCCIAGFFPEKLSLRDHSVEEVWNSEPMRQLRRDMLAGAHNRVCEVCYEREDRGEVSPRLLPVDEEASREAGQLIKKPEYDFGLPEPDGTLSVDIQFLDIRFSNLCNQKCRMCNHRYSSKWYEDELRMVGPETEQAPQQKLIRLPENTVEQLIPYLSGVKSIYFAGGEPLLMPEHFRLLTWLHESGRKEEIAVFYSTNLSAMAHHGVQFVDLWKGFRLVKLSISCDGFGAVGEYQRTGFLHDEFFRNLELVKTFANPMKYSAANPYPLKDTRIIYDVQYTTTIYNVFHIFDFLELMVAQGHVPDTDAVNLAYAWSPAVVSLNNADEKDAIVAFLEQGKGGITARKTLAEIDNLISFTKRRNDIPFEEVVRWNERLDEIRGTPNAFAARLTPPQPSGGPRCVGAGTAPIVPTAGIEPATC